MEEGDVSYKNSFGEYYSKNIHLVDRKLRTEDGCTFDIHRSVLAKKSSYFRALFYGFEEDKEEFTIRGIPGEVLKNILSYLYTGDIRVTEENVSDLMVASDYLGLDDIISNIQTYLKNNLFVRNCLSIYTSALNMGKGHIIKEIFRFVQTHFEEILDNESSNIDELPLEGLEKLLSDRNLRVKSENVVWKAIVKWVEADTSSRLSYVPSLLLHLSLPDVDKRLVTEIMEHDIVAKNDYCKDIIKSSNAECMFENFRNYLRQHPERDATFQRRPSKLHFIASYGVHDFKLYVTYDENVDLWRKVLEVDDFPDSFLILNDRIYMLESSRNRYLCYNIVEGQWQDFRNFDVLCEIFSAVTVQGKIYLMSLFPLRFKIPVCEVKFYDPRENAWFDAHQMSPISSFSAVSMNEAIYVVGQCFNNAIVEMKAQVYDPANPLWNLLPAPSIVRFYFALVAYQGELYVIGGGERDVIFKEVEVFDPKLNAWRFVDSLPYEYHSPKAMIVKDKLIVFDKRRGDRISNERYPPVLWNASQKCWEPVEKSSPMYNIHMYHIFSLESGECFDYISEENKDPSTVFERSHFG